jgi:hypothetical protein
MNRKNEVGDQEEVSFGQENLNPPPLSELFERKNLHPSTFFRKILILTGVTGGGSPSTKLATFHPQSIDTQSIAGGGSRFWHI